MSTVLLDSHALHWWTAEPEQLSDEAARLVTAADEIAVASITWYELARLATRERIVVDVPIPTWLETMARRVRTVTTTPSIAASAATLPDTFPGDPADRIIYATAWEHGWRLVTKDRRLREHDVDGRVTSW